MSNRTLTTRISVMAFVLLAAAGCARVQEVSPVRIPFVEAKPESKVSERLTANPPRTVAILPFSSIDSQAVAKAKTDGRAILRDNFHSYFRALPFVCKDIKAIDETLKSNGLTDIENINKSDPGKLGAMLNADAVIYGDIKSAVNFTGGVYSITQLNGTLRMVDAKTGETLWEVKYFEKIIGGAVGESSELVSMIESQVENAKTTLAYIRCADNFSRKVLMTLPNVKLPEIVPPVIEKVEVEPSGKDVFGMFDTINVSLSGEKGLRASFDIGNFKEGIPMVEVSEGAYRGSYRVSRGDLARGAAVVGKLTDAGGTRQNAVAAARPVSIAARPASKVGAVRTRNDGNGRMALAWDPPEGSSSATEYEIYRADGYSFEYKLRGKISELSFVDDISSASSSEPVLFYQIIACEGANKSDPSDPLKVEIK